MTRRLPALCLTAAMLFLLSGCFTLKMDMDVSDEDTVSGTMIFAVDEDLLDMTDDDPNEFDPDELPEGATVEPYAEDGRVGQKVTLKDVPLPEWNRSMAEQSSGTGAGATGAEPMRSDDTFSLVHDEDGRYRFEATMTPVGAEDEAGDEETERGRGGDSFGPEFEASMEKLMRRMLKDAEFEVSITFPGDIVESNGVVDGRTVTWDMDMTGTEPQQMQAVAMEPTSVQKVADRATRDGFPVGPVVGVAALVLVGLGLAALVVVRRRSSTT